MHERINSYLNKARARIYLQRVANGLVTGLIPALMVWMCLLVTYKTGWISEDQLWTWSLVAALFPLAGLIWALAHKIDSDAVAMRIDEVNRLKARLTTAWCFLKLPAQERTPFMEAAIKDAQEHLQGVRVAEATPMRAPRDLLPLALVLLATVGLVLLRPPEIRGTLIPEEPLPAPEAVFDQIELQIEKEKWEEEKQALLDTGDPKAEQLTAEVDKLFEDLEEKKIDREQFLKRLDEIKERNFANEDEEQWRPLVDELKDAHKELEKNKHTKALAESLEKGDLQQAAKDLQDLAKKLESGELKDKDIANLEKTLRDLAKKWEAGDKELEDLVKKKEKELEELKNKLDKELDEKQKQRLSRLERELSSLKKKRQVYREGAKGRTLKQLSRAAEEGADKLEGSKARGKGAERDKEKRLQNQKDFAKAMDKAASELKNTDKQANRGRAKDEVKRRLDEMKESARRNGGQKGGKRAENLQDFEQRAQGKQRLQKVTMGQPKDGQEGQEGKEGQQQGPGKQGKDGQALQGKEGEGGPPNTLTQGGPKEGAQGAQMSQGKGQKSQQEGQDGGKGDSEREGGDKAGSGGAEATLGQATELAGAGFKNTQVEGRKGAGPTRSEVIEAAAERGFATEGYKDIHVEYEKVAEEVLEKEEIPPGYRFYVRKYFDMIRPREAGQ